MKLHQHEVFNNSAASYRHIEAIPLAAAMGDRRLRIWHGFLFLHYISSA